MAIKNGGNLMRKKKGFTLVEVMIVVAIIALLAAIAIPNLLRARHNANESAAQGTLSTVSAAQQSWRGVNAAYTNLATLIAPPTGPDYIDETVDDGTGKQGYVFTNGANTTTQFVIIGVPLVAQQSGTRSFCVTEDGVVRVQAAGGAIADHDACVLLPATGN